MITILSIVTWCLIIAFAIYMRHMAKNAATEEFMKLLKVSVPHKSSLLVTLHPEVLGAWSRFLQHPEKWSIDKYTMTEIGSLRIWISNGIDERTFYAFSWGAYNEGYWSKEKCATINAQLTHYDKLLLELLRKKVVEYQAKAEESIAGS